jgi:hypothetical protein
MNIIHEQTNNNNIVLGTSLNKQDKKLYTLSRWAALYEAINMIADKTEEKQMSFERVELKPLKILEYVDATSDIIMRKMLEQKKNTKSICKTTA